MIKYIENGKFAYFDNYKFTRDDATGYYLNSTIGKRLHRYVWEYYNGEIPKGYHIHHKDGDRTNNDITNLLAVASKKHFQHHGEERVLEDTDWFKNFHKKGIEAAKEWHESDEGREWHKKHYERVKENFHEEKEFVCNYCGKVFKTQNNGANRFCSNKCKSAWRRREGLDDEERICEYCGKKFITNKYSKTRTCSKTCSNRMSPRLPQLRKNKKD